MPTISPTLPNDGETIDAQDVNGPFNAILGVLNGNIDGTNIKPGSLPWSVMDSFSEQIPASAMQKSGNLELFRQHANISFIASGLVWSALTGLNGGMTLGQYYSNNGNLLSITAISSYAFTASRDTYVSIGQTGTIGYSVVNNNATPPSLPANSSWLAKVVTGASSVTSIIDLRQTAPISPYNLDVANTLQHNFDPGSVDRTRSSPTPAIIPNASIQTFTSKTGKVKISMSATIGVNTETGSLGVVLSTTGMYTGIISTNQGKVQHAGEWVFTVPPYIPFTITPSFSSQSGASTIYIYAYNPARMIVEDVS